MQRNMTLLIDAETRDIVFDGNGDLSMIYDDDTTAQSARLTLLVYKEELIFDTAHGTDYRRIMGAKPNEITDDEISEIIRESIYQENNISQVNNITATRQERGLDISFDGILINGNTISTTIETGAVTGE